MESDTKTVAWADASSDNKRHQMTMKIADIAPNEAQLVDISERLSFISPANLMRSQRTRTVAGPL
jgi:hypothetical protein